MDKAKTVKTKSIIDKQSKNDAKSHINSFSKFILAILIIVSILFTLCVVYANLSQNDAIATKSLPAVPFAKHTGFCIVNKDIPNTDYCRGSMLIVKKLNEYSVGDKILFKNTQSVYKKHTINDIYLMGTILSTDAENVLVNINGINDKQFQIVNSILVGKATICIDNLGSIYNSMLGIKGYVLYCAIPFLTVLLIFFIMRLFVVSRSRSEIELNCIDGIQKKIIPDDKPESEATLAAITIETVNSTTQPIIKDNIELLNDDDNIDKSATETVRIYAPAVSRNNINSNHTPDTIKTADNKLTSETDAVTSNSANQNSTAISDVQNSTVQSDLTLSEDSTEAIEPLPPVQAISNDTGNLPLSQQDLIYADKNNNVQPLKADDIINLYRQRKKKIVLDKHDMKNYEEIAKMYYDNDINNY